jgi:tetratricopeptide (TPR) repeat protein
MKRKDGRISVALCAGMLFCLFVRGSFSSEAISARDYAAIGNTSFRQNSLPAAIDNYTKALALDSGIAEIYFNRGLAYEKQKQLDLAINDYSSALSLKPAYIRPCFHRAIAFALQKVRQCARRFQQGG